jgi:hypothetical protein
MSVPNCTDQSFGFVSRDSNLSNLRVSQILSSCRDVPTTEPTIPLVSVWRTDNNPTPLPSPSLNTFLKIEYDQVTTDTASMFTSPCIFTAPETGIYKIDAITLVGNVTSPDPFVIINNIIAVLPFPSATQGYLIGSVSLAPGGQGASISGSVSMLLNAGDQIASLLNMTDISGTSTAGYYGTFYGVRTTTLTIQKIA